MSLWKVRHGLSPLSEGFLITLAAIFGAAAIWLSMLRPLAIPATALIQSLSTPIPLDVDEWSADRNEPYQYIYSIPPGWIVYESGNSSEIQAARNRSPLAAKLSIEVIPAEERQDPEDVASAEFAGLRPALYDVGVAGRNGVFATVWKGRYLAKQAVYLKHGDQVFILRGTGVEPAVFATFVGGFHFFTL